MDIKGMLYFISAAENLSFTKAAIEKNVSQTAISLSISKMEEELGFQLFTRQKRSVQLTEAGKDFYENIVYVVKKYEEAVEHGTLTAAGKVGEIRLGVPDFAIGMSLTQSLCCFREAYPQINIKSVIIPPHKMMQAIDAREIDAAIGFPQEFEANPALTHRVFRKDKLMVAMALHHPLASCTSPTLEEISSYTVTVVHPQKAPMIYLYMCGIWERAGFKPRNVIHSPTLDDALLEVALGNAIILITEQSYSIYNSCLKYSPLKELEGFHTEIAISWAKNQESPIIKGLVWTLLDHS